MSSVSRAGYLNKAESEPSIPSSALINAMDTMILRGGYAVLSRYGLRLVALIEQPQLGWVFKQLTLS